MSSSTLCLRHTQVTHLSSLIRKPFSRSYTHAHASVRLSLQAQLYGSVGFCSFPQHTSTGEDWMERPCVPLSTCLSGNFSVTCKKYFESKQWRWTVRLVLLQLQRYSYSIKHQSASRVGMTTSSSSSFLTHKSQSTNAFKFVSFNGTWVSTMPSSLSVLQQASLFQDGRLHALCCSRI